jgi:hypothetical protein
VPRFDPHARHVNVAPPRHVQWLCLPTASPQTSSRRARPVGGSSALAFLSLTAPSRRPGSHKGILIFVQGSRRLLHRAGRCSGYGDSVPVPT